ncbi:unnamed protein product [Lactuca saligna]|uniref:Uncharacterized protein n=1 Tax=Lactuca saligna TaxID=75948 RepID=A0AA35YP67_LACSI|nr:unnamed protein product [Lactuca saligna]
MLTRYGVALHAFLLNLPPNNSHQQITIIQMDDPPYVVQAASLTFSGHLMVFIATSLMLRERPLVIYRYVSVVNYEWFTFLNPVTMVQGGLWFKIFRRY